MMIRKIENVLSKQDCATLCSAHDQLASDSTVKDHCGHILTYWPLLDTNAQIRSIIERAVMQTIKSSSSIFQNKITYPEAIILTKMAINGFHPLHADSMRLGDDGKWVPNHTPQRCYTGMFYLNQNYEGGQLCFDRQNIKITPTIGLFVGFPSDELHTHEVLPVGKGYRYSLAIWLTTEKGKSLTELTVSPIAVSLS